MKQEWQDYHKALTKWRAEIEIWYHRAMTNALSGGVSARDSGGNGPPPPPPTLPGLD